MEEGFRAMMHAAPDLEIDDAVQAVFVRFGDLTIPRCDRVEDRA